MKKLLLSTLLLGSAFVATSQVLLTENFNSYTTGNFATEVIEKDSLTNAQGDWIVGSTEASPSNSIFQITNVGSSNNNLKITSPSSDAYIVAHKFVGFTNRQVANNYLYANFKLSTGANSNLKGELGISFTLPTLSTNAIGFIFYPSSNKLSAGLVDYVDPQNPGAVGYFRNELKSDSLILEPNKDYYCEFIWDNNGDGTNGYGSFYVADWNSKNTAIVAVSAPFGPVITDDKFGTLAISSLTYGGNNLSYSLGFDEINVGARNVLGVEDIKIVSNKVFSIFPNPATDIVSVKFNDLAKVNDEIRLTSMDGKVIETRKVSNITEKFDVSTLKAGIYFFQIGDVTEKVIVK